VEMEDDDAPSRNGKGRTVKRAKVADEDDEELYAEGKAAIKKYENMENWEEVVASVQTVEQRKNKGMQVFFHFTGKTRAVVPIELARERFPQKLIDFFLPKLRWREADDDDD